MKNFQQPLFWAVFAAALTIFGSLYFSGGLTLAEEHSPRGPYRTHSTGFSQRAVPDLKNRILERERWQIQRHGFHLGVPRDAYAKAMNQRLRMEAVSKSASARGSVASTPNWTFIGPMPMKGQQANFGGPLFGPTFDAAGRVAAIAIDPSGNIYVGAAGGGVWLSKDHGATFTWISQALPTQSIGAIAIDSTNTSPPTVYVGTGEGNSAIDTYYGLGLWATQDFGTTWTQVDPSKFSATELIRPLPRWTCLASTYLPVPGTG